MVDPTKGLGPVQNIPQTQKPAVTRRADEARETPKVQDTIEIPERALDAQQAEDAARDTRDSLARNADVTLGLNPLFVDKTV
jgi:hypothetical protein